MRLPSRLPSLTSLRAFAALFVFANHAGYILQDHNPGWYTHYDHYVWNIGPLSLVFFFMLSGFVLTWGVRPGDTSRSFWRGRVVKVFPNHAVAFAITLGLIIASGESVRVAQGIANLFLYETWTSNQTYFMYPVNGVAWSLCVEAFCYACFPLLLLAVRRIRPERLWVWLIGMVLVAVVGFPLFAGTVLPSSPESLFMTKISWDQQWFLFFFPLTRSAEFVIGVLLARIVKEGRWIGGLGLRAGLVAVTAFYIVSLWLPRLMTQAAIYVIPMVILIGGTATHDLSGRTTFLNRKTMLWLGEVSFAFYITHVTTLFAVHAALGGHWSGYLIYPLPHWNTFDAILYMVLALPMCLVVGGLLMTFVERPLMRRFGRPKPRVRPDAAPDVVAVAAGS